MGVATVTTLSYDSKMQSQPKQFYNTSPWMRWLLESETMTLLVLLTAM